MEDLERLKNALADRYGIERELGSGGMATVYLAHDEKHDRRVAIKVLRPELAAVLGAERFLTEIRVTANLQHPHILPLHDSGEAGGFLFYVMPFVEGESLRDRLERETQLPVEEALRIAQEVADGLSHAHGLGVIHRDIKPENILLSGGHALIADFGIARAVTEAGGARLTETGLSLGTPHYMSPEQASGEQDVDARSDEYALGCVLYEMLVGEPPHTGPNAQAVIAKVLTQTAPSLRESRELVHPRIDAAVRKALAKLPADRFVTVEQFAVALQTPGPVSWDTSGVLREEEGDVRRPRPRPWSTVLAWSLVVILGAGVVFLLAKSPGGPASSLDGVARLTLDPRPANSVSVGGLTPTPTGAEVGTIAISDDGKRVAFIGCAAGETSASLYTRALDEAEARRIPETEGATSPFFSPDGDWIGFYSWTDGRLKTAPVGGGVPQVVCECDPILSADWGPDGTIVMDHGGLQGLRMVDAGGGDPEFITSPDEHLEDGEYGFGHPQFLPDGRHVLFTAWGGGGATRRIALYSLDSGERKTLLEEGWTPSYTRTGHIVFQRSSQLWAAPFDLGRLEIQGTPVPVLDSLYSVPFTRMYGLSEAGTLVYGPGPVPDVETAVYLVEPPGEMERIPIEAGNWTIHGPKLSPDGTRIVFAGPDPSGFSGGQGTSQIWIHDRVRGSTQPLTDRSPGGDYWPIWAPDGRSVVFTSLRGGQGINLFRVPADGSGSPEVLFADDGIKQAHSWLPNGQGLIFQRAPDAESDFDIWLLPLDGDGEAVPLLDGPSNENHPSISPDGRWLAYASDQTGRYEVYLRRYPELDQVRQVSTTGGMGPLWRSDSRELVYYREIYECGYDVRFMRVPVHDSPGTPEPMWEGKAYGVGSQYGSGYDLTPDGRQLLVAINEQAPSLFLPELRIVFNWFDELVGSFDR